MSKHPPKKFKKYIVFSILFIFVFSTVASLIVTMIPAGETDDQNPYQMDPDNSATIEDIIKQAETFNNPSFTGENMTDFTGDENINYTGDNINIITGGSNYSGDNYIMETDIMSGDIFTGDNMTGEVE